MESVVMALLERPWLFPLGMIGWIMLCLVVDRIARRNL